MLAVLVGAGQVCGEPAEEQRPLTAFAGGPFGQADVVVVADVEDVKNVRGLVTARVRTASVLKGDAVPKRLTILVKGPRPTLDPSAPSVPYLSESDRGRHVFFLARRTDGVGYFLLTLVGAYGSVGAEKVQVAQAHAALARIESYDKRARQTLAYLVSAQKKGGTWTRVHAARELNHLAGVRPDLFDEGIRARIRGLARGTQVPQQRLWLGRLLERLECEPVPAEAPPAPTDADPRSARLAERLRAAEDPQAFLERFLYEGGRRAVPILLSELPSWEDPDLRTWMVTTLAEGGYRVAAPGIRGLYARETEASVLRAIVRATGLLGTAADVEWLERRLANPRVYREVLIALARLRTARALAVLARERERAVGGDVGEAGDDLVALLDYLQSPAFVQVEARAGRSVGPSASR